MTVWGIVKLGDIAEVVRGSTITRKEVTPGEVPVIAGGQTPSCYHNVSNRDGTTITVSASGAYAGFVQYFEIPIFASDCSTIKVKDEKIISPKFLFYMLQASQTAIYSFQRGSGQPHVYPSQLVGLDIPVPPIEEQNKIIELLEDYLSRLDAGLVDVKQAIEKAKYLTTSIFHGATSSNLENQNASKFSREITLQRGFDLPKQNRMSGSVPIIASNGEVGRHQMAKVKGPGVITGRSGTIGRVHFVEEDFWPLNTTLYVRDFHGNDPEFVRFFLMHMQLQNYAGGSTVPSLDRNVLSDLEVSFPGIGEQKKIVEKMKAVEKQISDIFELCDFILSQSSSLKRSLLQRAFTGRLAKEVVSV